MAGAWFKLIRPLNLLILVFAQVSSFLLIRCSLVSVADQMSLSWENFVLILLSTLLVCSGGNIINDLFDREADQINKPGKNAVGTVIPLGATRIAYGVMSGFGAAIGMVVGFRLNQILVGFIPLISVLVLYGYSGFFQHRAVVGNLIVALLVWLSVLLPYLYDPVTIELVNSNFRWELKTFALLAVLSTWTREWIKDLEDREGDARMGARTAPLRWPFWVNQVGIAGTIIAQIVLVVTAVVLLDWQSLPMLFWGALILLAYARLLWQLSCARAGHSSPETFHSLSNTTKIIMVLGISWISVLALNRCI